MNALGDRCHSVLVLVDTTHISTPLIDPACGYHVGCVLTSASPSASPSTEDITNRVSAFLAQNKVECAIMQLTEAMLQTLLSSEGRPTDHLTKPVSVLDATALATSDCEAVTSLLSWLYGAEVQEASHATCEDPYTLVAVLDVSRGAPCASPLPSTRSMATDDAYAWLRPTPSYHSELVEAASLQSTASTNAPPHLCCHVFPVQMYSRYPVVRDRGLQEVTSDGAPKPVAQWTNKSTLDALLREMAFKAGQLAKYGA